MGETEKLNRRQLLIAILGSQIANSVGCGTATLPPAGTLSHTRFDVGHLIRDGLVSTLRPKTHEKVGVTIVGGGVAGLSAAWRLNRAGFDDFVLAELESVTGGTARSGSRDGFQFPWGAHYIPVPMPGNYGLIQLLMEMGVAESVQEDGRPVIAEQFLCRDPEGRILNQGSWYEGLYPHAGASDEDLRQLAAFRAEIDRWAVMRDSSGRRMFAIPMATGSDEQPVRDLDQISMTQWLDQHGWNSSRLRWFVDYSCRDDYGLSPDRVSAWAGVFYFAARIATVGQDSQDVITWPEGNGRIVHHLKGTVQKQLRTGLGVCRVSQGSGSDGAEIVAIDTDTKTPVGFRSEQVVFAAPQMMAKYVVEGFAAAGRDASAFVYGSWLVANVHVSDRPVDAGFPMAWDNVFRDSRSLGYVTSTHQTGLDHGATVLTWYYPFADVDAKLTRQRMLQLKWADWADLVMTDLRMAHADIDELVTRIDIMCWGHAMVQPRPQFIWGSERMQAAKPLGSIHFAGTDLSGIALFEEAFYHGVRAAEEILTVRGIAYDPLVEPPIG